MITTIDPQGSTSTQPLQINNAGQIIGNYSDSNGVSHEFLDDKGTITTIDAPGSTSTFLDQINASGEIIGGYNDSSGVSHGFLDDNGTITTIDPPGAVNGVSLDDINDAGGS